MIENIIVAVIVTAVAIFVGRRFYKTLSGKSSGCGCCESKKSGTCCGCRSAAKDSETPVILK